MKPVKRPYEVRQVLVCANVRDPASGKASCGNNGAEVVIGHLKKTVKERGLKGKVVATRSGCLDLCPDQGCIVAFQPDGEFFHAECTVEEAEAVLARLTRDGPA